MPYDPEIHHRRSIRLKEYDYSLEGAYFVTICTHQKECLFGDITDAKMHLNQYGSIVQACWGDLPSHYPHVYLDESIIMPNHMHVIILIGPSDGGVGARHALPLLGTIVGSFKSAVARKVNLLRHTPGYPVWQRNYYEHIIRNDKSLEAIQVYIQANPLYWAKDPDNPASIRKGEACLAPTSVP